MIDKLSNTKRILLKLLPHSFILLFIVNSFYLLFERIRLPDPLGFIIYWVSIFTLVLSIWNLKRRKYETPKLMFISTLTLFLIISTIVSQYFFNIENPFLLYIFNIMKFSGSVYFLSILIRIDSLEIKTLKTSKNLELILIISLLLIAFSLRIYKLDFLPPSVDEYYHLIAAKKNNLLGFYNYQRGAFVTEMVSFLFRIFSENSIFIARLPSVIAGVVTSFFIFKIGNHFNKALGFLAAFLFATCPLCIGMARYIREYEYLMAIFSICIYLLFNLQKDKRNRQKAHINWRMLVLLFINFIMIIYYFMIDKSGAIVEILGSEIIILAIMNLRNIWDFFIKLSTKKKTLLMGSFLIITLLMFLYFLKNYSWVINTIDVNTDYLNMFFDPRWTVENFIPFWYSQLTFIPQVLIIFIFILPLFVSKKQNFLLLNYLLFFFTTVPFVIFSNRYFGPRYVYLAILPFVIILAHSILLIFTYSKERFKKNVYVYFLVLILLFIFSPFNSIKGLVTETSTETDPKTRLSHYDPDVMFEFMYKNGYKDGDNVITTREDFFAFWKEDYPFILSEDADDFPLTRFYYYDTGKTLWYDYIDIGYYTYKNERNGEESIFATSYAGQDCYDNVCKMNEKQRVTKLMAKYSSGWLVLDKDRNTIWNSNGFPKNDFYTTSSKVTYIGSTESFKGFDLYFWEDL